MERFKIRIKRKRKKEREGSLALDWPSLSRLKLTNDAQLLLWFIPICSHTPSET